MTSQELSELKPGDTIYLGQLPVKFKSIKNTVIIHFEPCETSGLLKGFEHVSRFSILPMLHQPKYDPCRKFRKGDKVRLAENKGRCLKPFTLKIGDALTVSKDEPNDDTCVIWCKRHDRDFYLDPAYIELVTPVEELEPYYVGKVEINTTDGEYDTWAVFDEHGYIVAQFAEEGYKPGEAKARAEQERDSRNAEHRKEMEK